MNAQLSDTSAPVLPRQRVEPAEAVPGAPREPARRVARRVAPVSTQGVLLRVIQEVLDPDWSLATAAKSIVAHAKGELGPLRGARVHLLAGTADRVTLAGARALATVNMAIAEVEARGRAPGEEARHVPGADDEDDTGPR